MNISEEYFAILWLSKTGDVRITGHTCIRSLILKESSINVYCKYITCRLCEDMTKTEQGWSKSILMRNSCESQIKRANGIQFICGAPKWHLRFRVLCKNCTRDRNKQLPPDRRALYSTQTDLRWYLEQYHHITTAVIIYNSIFINF